MHFKYGGKFYQISNNQDKSNPIQLDLKDVQIQFNSLVINKFSDGMIPAGSNGLITSCLDNLDVKYKPGLVENIYKSGTMDTRLILSEDRKTDVNITCDTDQAMQSYYSKQSNFKQIDMVNIPEFVLKDLSKDITSISWAYDSKSDKNKTYLIKTKSNVTISVHLNNYKNVSLFKLEISLVK